MKTHNPKDARSKYHTQLAKMSFDKIFDLTAGVYINIYNTKKNKIHARFCIYIQCMYSYRRSHPTAGGCHAQETKVLGLAIIVLKVAGLSMAVTR